MGKNSRKKTARLEEEEEDINRGGLKLRSYRRKRRRERRTVGLEEGEKRKDFRFSDVRKTWDGNLRRRRRPDLEPQQRLPLSKL